MFADIARALRPLASLPFSPPRQLCLAESQHSGAAAEADRRGRLRARHHRLDGTADRGRQAQDLVDRHRHRRCQSRRRNPHGPRRLSRHRRRIRHQDVQSHHRYPGPLRQAAGAARRAAAATGRRASTRRCDVGVTKLSWTQGAEICRIMFLVGDAPPHMDYAQDTKYPEVMRMARERGIIVNAVQAGGARDTERVWREIAQTRRRPLHPDPAGRRPDRDHRDAVGHRDHRAAGPHQRHGHSVRAARAALQRRAEDRADRRGAASVASEMAGYLNKRGAPAAAKPSPAAAISSPTSAPGGRSSTRVKDEDLPDALRAMKPERAPGRDRQATWPSARRSTTRMAELVKKRDRYVMRAAQERAGQARELVRPRGRGNAEGADQALTLPA